MIKHKLILKYLIFTGPSAAEARVDFASGSNLIYGASNTGKSFTLKAIDFMLGGSSDLPDFKERVGYETIWLGFSLTGVGDYTLTRATKGGSYRIFDGLITASSKSEEGIVLKQKHSALQKDNLSRFLLHNLDFVNMQIACKVSGHKENLSFRDLAHILLVDETSIQSERSPIESGNYAKRTRERSVFRLMLTGIDDSAIETPISGQDFNASKKIRIETIDELIKGIEHKLAQDFPESDKLTEQYEKIENSFKEVQSEFGKIQGSIRTLLDKKHKLSLDIPNTSEKLEDLKLHFERFKQLDKIYISDIERLEGLEESSFLLSLGNEKPCSLCGAPPEAQQHSHVLRDVEQIKSASLKEIDKIKRQRIDLNLIVKDLRHQEEIYSNNLSKLNFELAVVEGKISDLAPKISENQKTICDLMRVRDNIKSGLELMEQKKELLSKMMFLEKQKLSNNDRPNLEIPDSILHDFCKIVSDVLIKWQFPGECQVSFDEETYDLKIDGKLRTTNGKGVRALTHAAFKIAMLLFCNKHDLPHPGLIVLDTPLLTYRDPMKDHKSGVLTDDEKTLAQTGVKQCFFDHLASIQDLGQFIILENVDPPLYIEFANIQLFHGNTDGDGRKGLFPVE